MKKFSDTIKWFSPLRFVADSLELSSSPGRAMLYNQEWITSAKDIECILDTTERIVGYFANPEASKALEEIAYLLRDLHPIWASIGLLDDPNSSASDVDLFELKNISLIERKVSRILTQNEIKIVDIDSLEEVLHILDIEGEELPGFYLSDKYSAELARLRKAQEVAPNEEEREKLALLVAREEDKVRHALTEQLRPHGISLTHALNALAETDLFIAKAHWAIANEAIRPQVQESGTSSLENLINPEVRSFLSLKGVDFQPVSIDFGSYPTIITGANMAGKSVLLHSIALAQMLLQYGFFILASKAVLTLVKEVMVSMDDASDQSKGLSSFGGEMLRLSDMALEAKKREPLLLLIDEAARTTNPREGRAIVEAMVALFAKYNTCAIITTHYSNIRGEAKRLRVRGFIEERLQKPLEIAKLNSYIDYSLVEEAEGSTPHEALRIAEILGVDEELLFNCRHYLEKEI